MMTQCQNARPFGANALGVDRKEENILKAKVYFTREITPEAVVRLYQALGSKLPGKVAVKVHSGE